MGYDPATKLFTQAGFDSQGTFQIATVRVADMKGGKLLSKGVIGQCEKRLLDADGAEITFATETLSCTELSKDRLVLVWSNRREAGDKPLPDWKLTYERAATTKDDLWKAYRDVAAGSWDGAGALVHEIKESGLSQGDKFRAHFTLRAEMDGTALVGESDFQMLDKPPAWKNRVMVGWDPAARQVRFLAFWSGGLVEEIILSGRNGNTFVGTYSAKHPGREPEEAGIRMDYTDADSCVITFLDGPFQGKELSSLETEEMIGRGRIRGAEEARTVVPAFCRGPGRGPGRRQSRLYERWIILRLVKVVLTGLMVGLVVVLTETAQRRRPSF